MGVVGESGCGKSTLARVIIHLLDSTDGSIYFEGEDITTVDAKKLRKLRENGETCLVGQIDPETRSG